MSRFNKKMFKFIVLFIFFLIGISTIYSSSELNNNPPINPNNENPELNFNPDAEITDNDSNNNQQEIISTGSSNTISLSNIKDAAKRVNKFIKDNNKLPKTVNISGKDYSMSDFLYLSTKAITTINSGSNSGVAHINVKAPDKPSEDKINGKKLSKAAYVSLANNVTKYIDSNSRAPNYASSPVGKIRYETLVWTFSKILEFEAKENRLPNDVTITDINNNNDDVKPIKPDKVNDPYKGENPSDFLKDTKNCQSTDPTIKNKAKEITKGCSNDREKADAIHSWVRKNIAYESYSNTKYGAVKTLKYRKGNCVDQGHLTIALCRASDLPARYGHGECTFTTSGNRYGHVWVQELIQKDSIYAVSDTTSSKNSLGIIKSWNTDTYKQKHGHRQHEITF